MKHDKRNGKALVLIENLLIALPFSFLLFSIQLSFLNNVFVFCVAGGFQTMLFVKYHESVKQLVSKKPLLFAIDLAFFMLVFFFILLFGYLDMSPGLKPLLR